MTNPKIYAADVIALYDEDKIVLIERLEDVEGIAKGYTSVTGYALPGGKHDPGESLQNTAIRETFEETGLTFVPFDVLATYAEDDRDPRGPFVTTVFIGRAFGTPADEEGHTRVRIEEISRLPDLIPLFAFDHGKIIQDYLDYRKI